MKMMTKCLTPILSVQIIHSNEEVLSPSGLWHEALTLTSSVRIRVGPCSLFFVFVLLRQSECQVSGVTDVPLSWRED